MNKHLDVIEYLEKLRNDEAVEAVMLFGSAARDELKETSDIDAVIIVNDDYLGKGHVLHPVINEVKLDLSVYTLESFEKETTKQAEKIDRIPMIGESKILFDKSGKLTKLRNKYLGSKPILSEDYRQFCKFMIIHNNSKVLNCENDETKMLFIIGNNLEDTLKRHYLLQGRWRIADKRILDDLKIWDLELYKLVVNLVEETNPIKKMEKWITMNKYLCEVNEINNINDTSCECESCKDLLKMVMKG